MKFKEKTKKQIFLSRNIFFRHLLDSFLTVYSGQILFKMTMLLLRVGSVQVIKTTVQMEKISLALGLVVRNLSSN